MLIQVFNRLIDAAMGAGRSKDGMALPPDGGGKLYEQAMDCIEKGLYFEAGRVLVVLMRRMPNNVHISECFLQNCGRLAQEQGRAPIAPELDEVGKELLSVIVCSRDDARYNGFVEEVNSAFDGWPCEILRIADAKSMNEGYSRGLSMARGRISILCHDDVGFLDDNIPRKILKRMQGLHLAGVAGTDRLETQVWWSAAPPHVHSRVSRPIGGGCFEIGLLGARGPVVHGAQGLDGMMLFAETSIFKEIQLDKLNFDGFHFYDIDLSWRAYKGGLKTGIVLDLPVWHASGGVFEEDWARYGRRFIEKHPELRHIERVPGMEVPSVVVSDKVLLARMQGWVSYFLDG